MIKEIILLRDCSVDPSERKGGTSLQAVKAPACDLAPLRMVCRSMRPLRTV